MRPDCPERNQSNVASSAGDAECHPYKKKGRVNGVKLDTLLDTGSHYTLLKTSVETRYGLQIRPRTVNHYGIGNTIEPSLSTLGKVDAEIIIDDVTAA